MAQVAKHRFDGGKALAVAGAAFGAVDGAFHLVGVAFFGLVRGALVEGDLPNLSFLRGAQALGSLVAGHTVAQGAAEFGEDAAVDGAVGAILIQRFARWANAGAGLWGVVEVGWPVAPTGFWWWCSAWLYRQACIYRAADLAWLCAVLGR